MEQNTWNPDKVFSYRYKSEYAEIVFNVPGMSDWDEDVWDSASEADLASYVTDAADYWLDDCWEIDIEGLDIVRKESK